MDRINNIKKNKKIVVAVDESKESMNALSWCMENLAASNSNTTTLVLLYVKPPSPVYSVLDAPGYLLSGEDLISDIARKSKASANSVMGRAEAIYRDYITTEKVERVVGSGDARDVICNIVDKLGADVLIMGSHGYGFFKRVLLGSVSDHCAKYAKCPVVIVKRYQEQS
ncbi:Adenine nucleotide alpha hydrolases-like superfamily protein [Euphorbia peplus]|nr:Adenine nucleotide alpha hydrolases-like superfamily protein [Euphorbia peplus]